MRWYCTGTSMAWVTRSRWAISRNFTTSDLGIRMVVPPTPMRRQHGDQRRVGVERRRGERDRVRAVVEGREPHRQQVAHGVAVQDALGQAGRARAVDDVEVVELARSAPRTARRSPGASQSSKSRQPGALEIVGDAAARRSACRAGPRRARPGRDTGPTGTAPWRRSRRASSPAHRPPPWSRAAPRRRRRAGRP